MIPSVFLWIALVNQAPLVTTRFQYRLLEAAVTAFGEGDFESSKESLEAIKLDKEMFDRATLGITEEPNTTTH